MANDMIVSSYILLLMLNELLLINFTLSILILLKNDLQSLTFPVFPLFSLLSPPSQPTVEIPST